jgi:hypothetical protein
VLKMPFDSSYIDGEKYEYRDSQDKLVEIAKRIVREPISTHIVKTRQVNGKVRFLVIDRSVTPQIGALVVVWVGNGFKVGRLKGPIKRDRIWGTVTWLLDQG